MGSIYRAQDVATGTPVAIKLLKSIDARPKRFDREVRLLAELEHPSIVRYVAHGFTLDGSPYLAMEWLEGEDLSQLLARKGRLPVDEALSYVRQAAEALAVAHGRGVIHRDIKPSNLFVVTGAETRLKVLDFGVARSILGEISTTAGALVGTPAYMAPEQARGDDAITPSADVYALGCVLYECLTGRPAFSGKHLMGLLARILVGDTPRLSALRSDLSPALDALVTSLLSRDPEQRPSDGEALLERLSVLSDHASGTSIAVPAGLPAGAAREKSLFCVLMIGSGGQRHACGWEDQSPDVAWQLRSIAVRHEARVELLRQGSALLVFEAQGAANDLAAKAASCALTLTPLFPETSMAIATGLGFNLSESPSGEVIDRATALLQENTCAANATLDGGVKVDAVTAGLIESRFELNRDASGRVSLRGFRDLGSARTLLGKPTPCLGRERELSTLESLFVECVSDSAARAVIITAAAGVGKSRLCQEFLARRRNSEPAYQLWRAWADPTRSGARFGLVKQAARAALGISESDSLLSAQEKLRARVAARVSSADQVRTTVFLGELVGVPFPDDESVQLQAARRDFRLMGDQIACAWVDWVVAECTHRPVLLVLDDVHWGDSSSLVLIDAALRWGSQAPFMVLALGRGETHERFPGLWKGRRLHQQQLPGLPSSACEALARSVLPESVTPAAVARIVERCAGNAFFLEELLRARAEGDAAELPGTVLAMLQARLARLPARARELLRAASVFGQSFWPAALERVVREEHGANRAEEVFELLVSRDWLTLSRTARFAGHTELSFRHALIREAAYALLHEDERRLAHRAAAEWLENAGERDAAVLAEHWECGGDVLRALECFKQAAQQSLACDDMSGSLAHADRAIALGATGIHLGELLLMQAEARNWRREHKAARALALEAIGVFEKCESRDQVDIERWAHAYQHAAWASEVEGCAVEVERHAASLMARVQGNVNTKTLVSLAYMAANLLYVGRVGVGAEILGFLANARGNAVDNGPAVEAVLDGVAGLYAQATSNIAESLRHFERAAAHAERAGHTRLLVEMHGSLAAIRESFGDYERAAESFEVAAHAQRRLSVEWTVVGANRALVELRLGRSDEAETILHAAVRAASEQGDRAGECYCRTCLARVLLERGRAADAEREASLASASSENFPTGEAYSAAVLAAALLAQERATEAVGPAQRGHAAVERGCVIDGEAFVRLVHAEVLLASGSMSAGRQALLAAAEKLQEKALKIEDAELRRKFLTRVPENARTLELARRWHGEQVIADACRYSSPKARTAS
jgi:hypothetical protein